MSALAVLGHIALFLAGVVLWVHLAADVMRFRDLQGVPVRQGSAWRRLLGTTTVLLLLLALAAALDSPAVIIALGWCVALRLLTWAGLRLALRLGWHAASDTTTSAD